MSRTGRMGRAAQLWSATRYALLSFMRNPAATFFTLGMPLVFMVLFGAIFGGSRLDSGAKVTTFLVPGILALSVVSATFVNLAMTTVFRRERNELKRLRATPMQPAVWIGAQMVAAFVLVALMALLMIVLGRVAFGVHFNLDTIGVFMVSALVGAGAFAALGLAISAFIPSERAASAVTNMIVLPLYFVSDVFVNTDDAPRLITTIGDLFPVKHLAQSFQGSFDPFADGVEIPWNHWLVMAAWGAVGVIVAARFFRWSPTRN